jgi:hypothetical protein
MRCILMFVCFALSWFASAQPLRAQGFSSATSYHTSTPVDSRFEIISTTSRLKATLKLDKYTGEVYELVKNKDLNTTKDEQYAWQLTKRHAHPRDKDQAPNEVNYQIYTTGEVVPYTYLINVKTGATWLLAREVGKEESYWYPIKHQ